ncbi:MAG: DUF2911 domain-containing protein [Cyclobacteriaceae bacterium]|jgi:hypothetical protein|nr:DUF2911 domain-containing protein [Cyclobacteriaceae bacterium]
MNTKKYFIIIIVFVILSFLTFFFYDYFRVLSPKDEVSLTSRDLTVSVTYSRPSVRDRLIFGDPEEEPLQPYGEYWRLGANDATEATFSRDVLFNGAALPAGTYRMYAIPGRESFEIVLNTETGVSGSQPPDPARDVLRTKVPVERPEAPVEQFTITLEEASDGIDMKFEWSDVRFVVPIAVP